MKWRYHTVVSLPPIQTKGYRITICRWWRSQRRCCDTETNSQLDDNNWTTVRDKNKYYLMSDLLSGEKQWWSLQNSFLQFESKTQMTMIAWNAFWKNSQIWVTISRDDDGVFGRSICQLCLHYSNLIRIEKEMWECLAFPVIELWCLECWVSDDCVRIGNV
jgi:hypothetical protein